MMLVVSLNQMPSMLSRTNGTWRRVGLYDNDNADDHVCVFFNQIPSMLSPIDETDIEEGYG